MSERTNWAQAARLGSLVPVLPSRWSHQKIYKTSVCQPVLQLSPFPPLYPINPISYKSPVLDYPISNSITTSLNIKPNNLKSAKMRFSAATVFALVSLVAVS